jgi:hypothetical protein
MTGGKQVIESKNKKFLKKKTKKPVIRIKFKENKKINA